MRIGILSDTHLPETIRHLDHLGPEPASFFSTVDLILHSGDLTSPIILDWLEQFAPVLCSTGNNDPIPDRRSQEVQVVEAEGWRIGMVHSLGPPSRSVDELQKAFHSTVDIMISGHTHYEALEYRDGVLLLNSGSITFPHNKNLRLGTVGLLELTSKGVHAELIALGNTPGRPNPGKGMALDIY
ncbi:MAG: metallophosphoesterase family protein [Dehalococcoidia bacterium]|nr:metallophosphoesterase family protein [Dehalococcoidia bacterium]